MKDKRQVPMKGDKALVINGGAEYVGRELLVTSDPEFEKSIDRYGVIRDCLISRIQPITVNGWEAICSPTEWLLRIPPDSEMKTMFGETEKPVKV